MFNPHKDITYNPLQEACLPFIPTEMNLVVGAPTSSGKTIVAEMAFLQHLRQRQRVIYLSPLKSLSEEQYRRWQSWPFTLSIITSDYQRASFADITIMTTESLDSKTRSRAISFSQVGLVVVDEAHLLGMPGRGDALEVGLMRLTLRNPNVRLILLSATLENLTEVAEWLTSLNRRDTKVVRTTWRPVEITDHFIAMPNREREFDSLALAHIRRILRESQGQTLIFVHTIAKGKKIAKAFGIPFHNARLTRKERLQIEDAFRSRSIPALVCTSTLAMGVNLPADNGIIVGAHRGLTPVDPLDLMQMRGRIGRYGLSEKGEVWFLIKEYMFQEYRDLLSKLPPIHSVLKQRLHFHVISLIARENANPYAFLERAFADITPRDIEMAIDMLIDFKCLTPEGQPTRIGRAAAMFYCDPFDLSTIYHNLLSYPRDPKDVAIAIASIPSLEYDIHIDTDLPITLRFNAQSAVASILYKWMSGQKIEHGERYLIYQYIQDFDRWANALHVCGLRRSYCQALSMAVQHGVGMELWELVKLKGIGRATAWRLWHAGYRSLDDILKDKDGAVAVGGKRVLAALPVEKKGGEKIRIFFK